MNHDELKGRSFREVNMKELKKAAKRAAKAFEEEEEELKHPPMGVSEWKAHGKRYGYWKFFAEEVLKNHTKYHLCSPMPSFECLNNMKNLDELIEKISELVPGAKHPIVWENVVTALDKIRYSMEIQSIGGYAQIKQLGVYNFGYSPNDFWEWKWGEPLHLQALRDINFLHSLLCKKTTK